MNNPFDYTPSESMLREQHKFSAMIERLMAEDMAFRDDVQKGKMFGILIARGHEGEEVLYSFSGQITGRFSIDGFVPPVYDYLAPDGYFKTHEAEITSINHRVKALQESTEYADLRQNFSAMQEAANEDIETYKAFAKKEKEKRQALAEQGVQKEELIRESQFQKAELHRKKLTWRERLQSIADKIEAIEAEMRLMKLQRQRMSDHLQRWLFEQFVFTNHLGEHITPLGLATGRYKDRIPSGTGECCEIKLLNYAFSHNLLPEEIGMFWWGASPNGEIRHHLSFYPACQSKCRPVLEWMLPDEVLSVEKIYGSTGEGLEIVYEDEHLIVVNKPAGMLSVPGNTTEPNVYDTLRNMRPEITRLQMVHRLDMDTSGLLLVAKDDATHKYLQQRFASHNIYKVYYALLEHMPIDKPREGVISLPLSADYDNRPRQRVDYANGKEAITRYTILGNADDQEGVLVKLEPLTGRTHQLRMHCAHPDGLGVAIKGDRLYGRKADRLYLHAAELFDHTPPPFFPGDTFLFKASPFQTLNAN